MLVLVMIDEAFALCARHFKLGGRGFFNKWLRPNQASSGSKKPIIPLQPLLMTYRLVLSTRLDAQIPGRGARQDAEQSRAQGQRQSQGCRCCGVL